MTVDLEEIVGEYNTGFDVVGIDVNLNVYGGYDTYLDEDQDMTVEKKKELADQMIILWTEYRNKLT